MIVILANEEVWKYNSDYFYYPICLPTLKLVEKIFQETKLNILVILNSQTKEFLKKVITTYKIKVNFEELELSDNLSSILSPEKFKIYIDLNCPLLYYKQQEILNKLVTYKNRDIINLNINPNLLQKDILDNTIEYTFKIANLNDIYLLFSYVKQFSRKLIEKNNFKNNILLGDNIFICPLSELEENNVILENTFIINSRIGKNNRIGPNTMVYNSQIENNNIVSFSVINSNHIVESNNIGPFSHLRENNVINESKIGAFVECKNIKVEGDLKASHLAYLGDLIIEKHVNIGAGAVFANYDGKNKYTTIIKENSFIGSNSVVISPKIIGPNSYIGAGSVVTKNVEENTVVVGNPAKVLKKYEITNK